MGLLIQILILIFLKQTKVSFVGKQVFHWKLISCVSKHVFFSYK